MFGYSNSSSQAGFLLTPKLLFQILCDVFASFHLLCVLYTWLSCSLLQFAGFGFLIPAVLKFRFHLRLHYSVVHCLLFNFRSFYFVFYFLRFSLPSWGFAILYVILFYSSFLTCYTLGLVTENFRYFSFSFSWICQLHQCPAKWVRSRSV